METKAKLESIEHSDPRVSVNRWTGENAADIARMCEASGAGGLGFGHGGQSSDVLTVEARHGPVDLHVGDWLVREVTPGLIRLSDAQMQAEYPEARARWIDWIEAHQ